MRNLAALLAALSTVACGPPQDPDAWQAQSHFRQGQFQDAETAAQQTLARDPDNPEMRRLEIDAAIRRGDSARGVELYMQWHRHRRSYDAKALRSMAISTLRRGLVENAPDVRATAVRAIARARLRQVTGELLRLLDDPAPQVVVAVVLAVSERRTWERATQLAQSGDASARARLLAGAPRSYRKHLAGAARTALGDQDGRVRKAAASAIGRFGLADMQPQLLQRTTDDSDGSVRAAALRSLTKLGDASVEPVARKALTDDHLGVRLAALAALAQRPKANRALLQQLAHASDSFLALRAAVVARRLGYEVPMPTLQLALGHRQWAVRVAAVNALPQLLPERDAVSLLEPLLTDARIEVRLATARALVQLGHKSRARPVFIAALGATTDGPRVQAAIDLLRLKDDSGRDALTELARSPAAETRRMAAEAHAYTDNPGLPLVHALGDADAKVRLAAAATLLELLD